VKLCQIILGTIMSELFGMLSLAMFLVDNVPMRLLYMQLNFCPPSQARGVPEVQLIYKSLIGSTSTGDPNLIIMFNPNHNQITCKYILILCTENIGQGVISPLLREPHFCLCKQYHHHTLLRLIFAAFIPLAGVDVGLDFEVIEPSEKDGRARILKKHQVPVGLNPREGRSDSVIAFKTLMKCMALELIGRGWEIIIPERSI
jgi:hypothetical protein